MNKRFRSKHSLARIVSWLLIASPVLAGQALAQSAESSSGGEISEIVVTAQKRSERLQEIPAAATVVTSTDLVNASVQTVQDVATLTPNLVIIDQLRPGIQTVSFRGFTTVQGGQSPFAIVVDGVPEPGQVRRARFMAQARSPEPSTSSRVPPATHSRSTPNSRTPKGMTRLRR